MGCNRVPLALPVLVPTTNKSQNQVCLKTRLKIDRPAGFGKGTVVLGDHQHWQSQCHTETPVRASRSTNIPSTLSLRESRADRPGEGNPVYKGSLLSIAKRPHPAADASVLPSGLKVTLMTAS